MNRIRLQQLTAFHERVRQQMLGEPIEEKRRLSFLLHQIENEMRKEQGFELKPWIQTEFEDED